MADVGHIAAGGLRGGDRHRVTNHALARILSCQGSDDAKNCVPRASATAAEPEVSMPASARPASQEGMVDMPIIIFIVILLAILGMVWA
ncbi:MAG: hypothetical protein ACRDTC_15070, partial [Pseudonocardiaceae bacterium]